MPLSPDLQRQLARFKHLPGKDDVWEGELRPLPTWIEQPDGHRQRPVGAVWASTIERLAHFVILKPDDNTDDAVVSALLQMGTTAKLAGYRPRGLRVRDDQLAALLRESERGRPICVIDQRTFRRLAP